MEDTGRRRGASGCNESCGCPIPCPGGTRCRCPAGARGEEKAMGADHMTCQCGEHCGCNPCTCEKASTTRTERGTCRCGPGCTCVTCSA